jgi:endonuclease/exonuclease/phosphatase family metal-dependent hydrolase
VYVGLVAWRVLIWNLKHGRAVPSAGRALRGEFTAALGSWEWDVALLQEVPPWWPPALGQALGADQRLVLTSRNSWLSLRRAIATRKPDLIKSNGGGANTILVRRAAGAITAHRVRRLSVAPERRWVHGVRVACGPAAVWVCNLHTAADPAQGRQAAAAARRWAGSEPVILGGDFNVRELALSGFQRAGGQGVDHVYVRGLASPGAADVLEHGALSDHAPIAVTVGGGQAS